MGNVGTDSTQSSHIAAIAAAIGADASAEERTVLLTWLKDSDGTAAADLSVSQHTLVLERPSLARYLCVNLGWPAPTGEEPVGVLAAVILGHPSATSGAPYPQAMLSPAGTADGQIFTIDTQSAPAVKLTYTRTSGGTAATWSGADGTGAPTATWGG